MPTQEIDGSTLFYRNRHVNVALKVTSHLLLPNRIYTTNSPNASTSFSTSRRVL